MKRYAFLALLLGGLFIPPAVSQTSLAPIVGVELFTTLIEEVREPDFRPIAQEKDTRFTAIYGIACHQQLFPRFSASFSVMYAEKDFNKKALGFFSYIYSRHQITRWDYSLYGHYNIWKGLNLGAGGTYSTMSIPFAVPQGVLPNQREAYWIGCSLTYQYKNFWLELRHNQGVKTRHIYGDRFFFQEPPTSTALTLRYHFQVLPLKNRRKEKCPEF
jgi:hypothetical protein